MKRATCLRPAQGGKFFGPVAGLTSIHTPPSAPRHACFLCKRAVDNDRRFAVCGECDDTHDVRALWAIDYGEIEAANERNLDRECFCPGWLWMNENDDGSFNIERCDTCARFRDDHEGALAMIARCNIRDVDWSA